MCSHTACLTQGPVPGNAQFWEAPRKFFCFRQVTAWQFAAAICSSWLYRSGDELHRGSFPMVFWPCQVLSPSGVLGLVHFHLSHVPSCGVLWLLHHGSSQDFIIFSCEFLSVLRAAVLSTSPNSFLSDFLEMGTFLFTLFIEINLCTLKRTWFEFSKQWVHLCPSVCSNKPWEHLLHSCFPNNHVLEQELV